MIDTDRNPSAGLDASAVSWAAILAGGVTAAALTVVLVVVWNGGGARFRLAVVE